jgi:hypothetical protein
VPLGHAGADHGLHIDCDHRHFAVALIGVTEHLSQSPVAAAIKLLGEEFAIPTLDRT